MPEITRVKSVYAGFATNPSEVIPILLKCREPSDIRYTEDSLKQVHQSYHGRVSAVPVPQEARLFFNYLDADSEASGAKVAGTLTEAACHSRALCRSTTSCTECPQSRSAAVFQDFS